MKAAQLALFASLLLPSILLSQVALADAVLIYLAPSGQSQGKAQAIDQVYRVGSTLIVMPKDHKPVRVPFLTAGAAEDAFVRITEDEASISIEGCAAWGKPFSSQRWSADPKCRTTVYQPRFKCGVLDATPIFDLSEEEIRSNYQEVTDLDLRPLEVSFDACEGSAELRAR